MKGYSLVKDNKTHFDIGHPDRGTFQVAKHGLDKAMLKKIQSLPKGMADGGEVEDPDESEAAPDAATETEPQSGGASGTWDESPAPAQPAVPGYNQALIPHPLDKIASIIGGAGPGVYSKQEQPSADDQPAAVAKGPNPNVSSSPGAAGAPKSGMQTVMDSSGRLTSPMGGAGAGYDPGFDSTIAAIKAAQGQQGQASDQAQAAGQDYAKNMQLQQIAYQKQKSALDDQNQQLTEAVANQKIDPNRVWSSASTGNKIGAVIGMLLSGIGSGLSGQKNMAMEVINNTINRDIDAQKSELGKKENLLSLNYRKYGDLNQAMTATASQMHAVLEGQLSASAAKSGNAQTQMQAAGIIQQIRGQQNTYNMTMALRGLGGSAISGGESGGAGSQMSPQSEDMLNTSDMSPYKGRVVRLPNGSVGIANSPKEADMVKDASASHAEMNQIIQQMQGLNAQAGATGAWSPALRQQAKALKSQALTTLMQSDGFKRLSDADIKFIGPRIPDLGSINAGGVNAAISGLQTAVDSKMNGLYGAHMVNYNPGKAATSDQTFARK